MEGPPSNFSLNRENMQSRKEQLYGDSIIRRDDTGDHIIITQNEGIRRCMMTTGISDQQASISAKIKSHPQVSSGLTRPNTYSTNHTLRDTNPQTLEKASRQHLSTNCGISLSNQAYSKTNGVRYDQWTGDNGDTNHPGNLTNGFDDIFQLMDASYVISEQIADMDQSL
jgi:hypothetical protein